MTLALILLERKIRVASWSKVLKESRRKGIANSWPLHYSEMIRHIIRKRPGEGEVQTTDETGSGQEVAPVPPRAKDTGLLTQHKATGKLERVRGPPVSVPLRREDGKKPCLLAWLSEWDRRQVDLLEASQGELST